MAKRPAHQPVHQSGKAQMAPTVRKPILSGPALHVVFAGLAVLLVLVYFGGLILKSSPPQAPDTVASDAISKMSTVWRGEHGGEMPLWTPAVFSGMPSYGSMIYTHENPVSYLIGKLTFGNFGILMAAYSLIGGACVYLLLVRYKRSPLAAFFASAVYMFTPYIPGLINAGHNNKILAAAIIPALLLVTDGLLRQRSLKAFAWFVLVTAWQLWVRHPQVTYYGMMLIGCILLADVLVQQTTFAARIKRFALDVGLLAAGLIFALGIVADPYLPVLEFTPESVRGGSPSAATQLATEGGQQSDRAWEFATQWSMHPKELITFLVPSFYGLWNDPRYDPQTEVKAHTYWGYMPFTQSTHYLGLIPILLALLVRPGRTALLWGCVVFSAIALFVGLGQWFPVLYRPAFEMLPYFAKFRVPSMIYMLLPLSVAIVGAWALDQLMEGESTSGRLRSNRRFAREENIAVAAGVLMAVLALGVMVAYKNPGWLLKAGEENYPPQIQGALAQVRATVLSKDLLIAALLASLVAGGVLLVSRRRLNAVLFAGILTVATIADLWRLDFTFLDIRRPTFAEAPLQKPVEADLIRGDLKASVPDSVRLWEHIVRGDTLFRIAPVAGLDQAGNLMVESTNEYGQWGLQSVNGYHAAKLRSYDDLTISGGLSRRAVLNMLNTRYVIAPAGLPDSTLVPIGAGQNTVYRNTAALPRAWWVPSVRPVPDGKSALSGILAPGFDPSSEAIVVGSVPPVAPDSTLSAPRVTRWDFHRIEIETGNAKPAFLVLSEVYYPEGWHATADGKPLEINQTNFILRGMYVPAGTTKVELTYDNAAYRWGRRLSFTLFPLFLLLVAEETWRERRRKGAH